VAAWRFLTDSGDLPKVLDRERNDRRRVGCFRAVAKPSRHRGRRR